MLRLYTSRLSHRGRIGYLGPGGFNVTRGSGDASGLAFAPSRILLDEANRRKRRAKDDEEKLEEVWRWYLPRFLMEMRWSWMEDRAAWLDLLHREGEVTLLCYCGTARRCHRRPLAELLVAAGRRLGREVADCGERVLPGAPIEQLTERERAQRLRAELVDLAAASRAPSLDPVVLHSRLAQALLEAHAVLPGDAEVAQWLTEVSARLDGSASQRGD